MRRATAGPIKAVQLAQLVDEAPDGPEWIHEQKFDGYRILADKQGDKVRLLSRRFNDWTAEFPTRRRVRSRRCRASARCSTARSRAVLPDGRTSFQALQNASRASGANLAYFVFDLLRVDGEDLDRAAAARAQGSGSKKLVGKKPRVRALLGSRRGQRQEVLPSSRASKASRASSASGATASTPAAAAATWLKTKCLLRQELVIGGYTDPEGARNAHRRATRRLSTRAARSCTPARSAPASARSCSSSSRSCSIRSRPRRRRFNPSRRARGPVRAGTGCSRRLVGEVAFSEWTADGRLRHPSFQGLRKDKTAAEVVREQPKHVATDRGG